MKDEKNTFIFTLATFCWTFCCFFNEFEISVLFWVLKYKIVISLLFTVICYLLPLAIMFWKVQVVGEVQSADVKS
jgi:hypothetical protein